LSAGAELELRLACFARFVPLPAAWEENTNEVPGSDWLLFRGEKLSDAELTGTGSMVVEEELSDKVLGGALYTSGE
tara:strand:+ start:337 stop:564 length:228 start_codon:yes stop_codon:yes gene_type:complete